MEFIKCGTEYLDALSCMYSRVVENLEKNINYPKWSKSYPCRESIKDAIEKGGQYVCAQNGVILGAAVLNEDPNGNYDVGDWSKELKKGEYLIIHTLAVDPLHEHKGVGGYMVDKCIDIAESKGYKAIRLDVVPDNIPAINLYKSKGFTFAGIKDLSRNINGIPLFGLYELNF